MTLMSDTKCWSEGFQDAFAARSVGSRSGVHRGFNGPGVTGWRQAVAEPNVPSIFAVHELGHAEEGAILLAVGQECICWAASAVRLNAQSNLF